MTGEEMERAIEFLLQSQANFETRLTVLEGLATQTSKQVAETSKHLQAYAETQTEFIQIVTTAIQGLTAAQARTDERLSRTDERLKNLAALIERYISENRNGNP